MGELTIRRNRGFAVPRYQGTGKAEKQSGSAQSQKAARTTVTISETLQRLMSRVSQAESHIRESRRTLQTGEGALAEVQDHLSRMAQLARESSDGSAPDRAALQAELEQLRGEIDRMIHSATAGGTALFLDEEMGPEDSTEALLYAVMGEALAKQEVALPDWLIKGLAQDAPTRDALLSALGLHQTASPSELLAAISGSSLETNSAAGYLAALYLGAIISGSTQADSTQALDGLRQLLETVAEGVPLDQAIERLTDGTFTSLADFQAQFTGGSAPGLQEFLTDLLLAGGSASLPAGAPLLTLLAEGSGVNLELMMELLTAVQSSVLSSDFTAEAAPEDGNVPPSPASPMQFGNLQAAGRDLSGVSFDETSGELVVGGTADVRLQGTGAQAIRITGSGTVTLQDVDGSVLTVDAAAARIVSAGRVVLQEVRLEKGVSLLLDGSGLVKIGLLRGDSTNLLRLTGGAVVLSEPGDEPSPPKPLAVPVLLDGPVSLAARAVQVNSGKPLEAFDLVWKTLLPGWSSITALEVDGRQAKMALLAGDPARLWLTKGEQGYPQHTVVIRGRDEANRPQTRYAYLHWNQQTGAFQEVDLYPNPFAVTGGEPGRDWIYEESSHTLRILSSQVTAISGGMGTDGNQVPFSGRLALADHIGTLALTLGGVVCRVSSGRAFRLGRGNDVTLVLQSGTENRFESGAGCAGISLEEGTSLCIDHDGSDDGSPAGTLVAVGNAGGAGIGRDSGGGRDQNSHILILGGVITAAGTGGGAGIGAGKHAAMGSITIIGGVITSTGGTGGGAGIGAALGAAVGDISIQGGTVAAEAVYHAAAIGAGVQGACGDILISGTAQITKALGGDPGADIGACLFGSCGIVQVSDDVDIGAAQLRTQSGIPLQLGEDSVTLPQFRLSSRTLQLDSLSIITAEGAQDAQTTLDADRRWVCQIQSVYSALYTHLNQSFRRLFNVHQYIGVPDSALRDSAAASVLLEDIRQSIPRQSAQAIDSHSKRRTEDVQQLLQ